MKHVRLFVIVLFTLASTALAQQQIQVAAGYNYSHSDQGSGHANLNGWVGQLSYGVTNTVSIVFETDNYYGMYLGSSVNQHNYVVGPQFTFGSNEQKLRPLVYVQAGDQRSSSGTVQHAFNLQTGGGVQVKLGSKVNLQLIPAEYNLATPSGGALHSYDAKAVLSFTLWQKQ